MAQAGDRVDQLRLAVRVDAGEAEDLAGADGEAHVANGLEPAVVEDRAGSPPRAAPSPGCAAVLSTRSSTSRPTIIFARPSSVAPVADTVSTSLPRRSVGDPVGDLEHLVELVRDEDDRLPLRLERSDDLEELLRLLRREHCGRLVEHEDLGTAVERLQDLDALLLADRDPVDARVGVDGEPVALRQLVDAPVGGAVVEQHACTSRLGGEHDVLGDGHHRDEHEMLVHHADPVLDRGLRRAQVDRLAAEQDATLVGRVEPVEDVHQSRLPGPVLAEQRVHLTREKVEVDVVVGEHSREPLGDSLEREDRCLSHAGRSYSDRPSCCDGRGGRSRPVTFARAFRYLTVDGMPEILPAFSSAYCAATAARIFAGTFELHLP